MLEESKQGDLEREMDLAVEEWRQNVIKENGKERYVDRASVEGQYQSFENDRIVHEFGEYVLNQACQQNKAWQEAATLTCTCRYR